MDVRDLERRLTAWSPRELTALLERRADVLHGRPPASVGELARRLAQPSSVVGALRGLAAPHLQVLDAVVGLGERASRPALAEILAGDGPVHEADVDAVLADLAVLALVAMDGAGTVHPAPGGGRVAARLVRAPPRRTGLRARAGPLRRAGRLTEVSPPRTPGTAAALRGRSPAARSAPSDRRS